MKDSLEEKARLESFVSRFLFFFIGEICGSVEAVEALQSFENVVDPGQRGGSP